MRPGQLLLAFIGFVLGAPLFAGEFYVDAVHGNDQNSGLAPGDAWLTITHALQAAGAPPVGLKHVIHVAPGVYDPQLGEVFPLTPPPRVRIVGTLGSQHTILRGSTSSLLLFSAQAGEDFYFDSGADGLCLRDSLTGLALSASDGDASPQFDDLWIQNMQGAGIDVFAANAFFVSASAWPGLSRTVVEGCATGIRASASPQGFGGAAGAGVGMVDSTVRWSSGDGIALNGFFTTASLEQCRIVENRGNGVSASGAGRVEARASLFARNQGCGAVGGSPYFMPGLFWFRECTFAHNMLAGVKTWTAHNTNFSNSIFAGNGDDLDLSQAPAAGTCDSTDGDLLGYPGCIAADPLFLDPSTGEFRLRFGSPCIDTGDPAPWGQLDLLGHARPFDGDLDTQLAVDMGALEFEPLQARGECRIGKPIRFGLWGEPGERSRLLLCRGPLVSPILTPHGLFYLRRGGTVLVEEVVLGALPSGSSYVVPNDPLLIGQALSFQALTTSLLSPSGSAWTNPVSFVIGP